MLSCVDNKHLKSRLTYKEAIEIVAQDVDLLGVLGFHHSFFKKDVRSSEASENKDEYQGNLSQMELPGGRKMFAE